MIVSPARNVRPLLQPAAGIALALTLAACGGGDPAAVDGAAVEPGPVTADGPLSPVSGDAPAAADGSPAGALAADLLTAKDTGDDFDLWFCSTGADDAGAIGYAFDADGTGTHYKVLGDELGPVAFDWRVAGDDAVELSYPGADDAESLQAIAFAGEAAWAGTSSADGPLDCTLQAVSG